MTAYSPRDRAGDGTSDAASATLLDLGDCLDHGRRGTEAIPTKKPLMALTAGAS